MSFSLDASSIPHIQTYAQAVEVYEHAPKLVPSGTAQRLLGRKTQQSLTIFINRNRSVELAYHGNPCVIYHPDNSIELSTCDWNTVSTTNFIHRQLPCRSERGNLIVSATDGRYVLTGMPLILDADRNYVSGGEDYTVRKLNRSKAAKINAQWRPVFQLLRMWVEMGVGLWVYGEQVSPSPPLPPLREVPTDPAAFVEAWMAYCRNRWSDLGVEDLLREKLYIHNEVWDFITYPNGKLP